MLERFLEQQPAISATLLSPEVRRNESDLCTLSELDITVAEDVVKALGPLKTATLVMSEKKSPTLSVIAPLHAQLLAEMNNVTHDSTVIKDLKTAAHNNLKSRYVLLKDKLYVASALDPRFKTLPFLTDEARDNTFSRLVTEAASLEPVDASNQQSDGDGAEHIVPVEQEDNCHASFEVNDAPTPPKKPKESSALMSLLGPAYTPKDTLSEKTAADKSWEEVSRYREIKPIPHSENPLTWWRLHAGEYPLLARQAKCHLCIPGTKKFDNL
ncbi:E3 SUMO-protein ligase ZBED1-like [Brachyhypopomus gauderio]|uniref:E3 SUMO-protein ligase ZBED1-like n=1 Tax=Brachyhypopomus gauderio TaxID=698409 RepID=UPI004043386E